MSAISVRQPFESSFRTKQPGKGAWTVFVFLFLPLRLAFLLLYFIPKRFRQHPTWTYHQSLGSALLKLWFSFASTVEYRTRKSLEPGTERDCFVVLSPAESRFYSRVASDKQIHPAPLGGMWYPKSFDSDVDNDKKIVLHFHPGAYVLGGVRPMEGGWGPSVLAKAIDGLVFCPQYRLSSEYKGRFPAALQDSITSYRYLLSQGILSSQIVISGDSAGGNLALALLRYLGEQGSSLPLPFAAFLWSPWLDLAANPNALMDHRNYEADYITPVLIKWGVRAYRPPFLELGHPYLSPLNNPFATEVPIFMQCGTAEVFYDEQQLFYLQMKKFPGNRMECVEITNAPHNTFAAGPILGFQEQARAAADSANTFLDRQYLEA